MEVKYRIIKKEPENRKITVRFFSDTFPELSLASFLDPTTLQPVDLDDNGLPKSCRTDVTIELPIKVLTTEEETSLIMRFCRWDWFEKEERMFAAQTNTDTEVVAVKAAIEAMSTQTKTLVFAGTPKTDEGIKLATWEDIKIKRTIMQSNGGFKVVHDVAGVPTNFWFHTDSISTTQQLGLISAAILYKMQGAADSTPISPIPWSTMDNSEVILTVGLALKILPAAMAQQGAIFAAAKEHRVALNASNSPRDYSFESGWPTTFQTRNV